MDHLHKSTVGHVVKRCFANLPLAGVRRFVCLWMTLCFLGGGLSVKAQINTERMMTIGRNALYFKDYVLSIQYFNQVVNAKPYLYDPYFFRGLAKFYLDDYTGAERDCSMAIERNPFVVDCYQVRGLSRIRMNRFEEAMEDYRTALKHAPEDEGLWHNLALCYINMKEYDEAIGVLDTLHQIFPKYAPTLNMRAQVRMQQKDTVRALADLNASVELDKYDPEVYSTRAVLYLQLQQYKQAEEDLTYAIYLSPKNSGDYINRALAKYYQHNLRGAMADYDLALDIDSLNFLGHYNRGLLRAQVGDDNRAIEDFDFVMDQEPDNTIAAFNRALLYEQTGNLHGAEQDLSLVLKDYPKFWYGYQCRANVRRKLGNLRGAEADELVVLKAQMEEYNRRSSGQDTAAADAGKEEENGEADATRKKSDKNIKKYKRLVVADTEKEGSDFTSEYRGKVQDKEVYVQLQPMYVLTYYERYSELKRMVRYHRSIEALNRNNALPMQLLITNAEKALDEKQINYHFKDIDEYSAALAAHPENGLGWFARGLDFYLVQDLTSALDDFTRAIVEDGDLWMAYFNRAVVRYKQIELTKASGKMDLQSGATDDSDVSIRMSEYQLVLGDLNKVLDLAPDFAYGHYNRGNILSQLKDYKAAIVGYNEAIALDAHFAEAYYNRGLTQLYLGKVKEGIDDLSKAGELGLYSAYNLIKRYAD